MSKWDNVGKRTHGNSGSGNYIPRFARASAKFSPKKTVKSFRDLEVYQKTLECSVKVGKEVVPQLTKAGYPLIEGMKNCSLSIPLLIAEAHGMRFQNFDKAVATLESAMQGCNKMIVYLEQAAGLHETLDGPVFDDLSSRYLLVRGKMLRLERSWQKFRSTPK